MNFYDALDEAMKREGVTQSELLAKAGRSHTFISNAKARGSIPQVDTAARLANATNYKIFLVPADVAMPETAMELTDETQEEKNERVMERVKKLEAQARELKKQIKE